MLKQNGYLAQVRYKFTGVIKAVSLALLLQCMLFISLAQADTITVSTCQPTDLITAINQANSNGQANTIVLNGNCTFNLMSPDNITYYDDVIIEDRNGLPLISSSITIEGHGATIQRAETVTETFRFFKVQASGQLTLSEVTLRNGVAEVTRQGSYGNQGGAIYNLGKLVLSQTTLISNYAHINGGAIMNEKGSVWVTNNSVISGNTTGAGGGIYNWGNLTVTQSIFRGNHGVLHGGAIYNRGKVIVSEAIFQENSAQQDGGAIWSEGAVNVMKTTFTFNDADSRGGAIYNLSNFQVSESTIDNNTARFGGGVFNFDTISLTATAILTNEGFIDGGGLRNSDTMILTNVTIGDNFSAYNGGGIMNYGFITMTHSTIVSNASYQDGAGIYNNPNNSIVLSNTLIAQNIDYETDTASDVFGTVNSQGFNLIGMITGSSGFGGNDFINQDPLISPLQNNGGTTLSYLPLPSSPVIDAGSCLPNITKDQRGQPRPNPVSPLCDIGAIETDLRPIADLALSQTVSLTNPVPAQIIKFQLTLTNSGPNSAKGVVVSDLLPSGYSLVSATPSQGSYNEKTGAWDVGTVMTNSKPTLTLEVKVNAIGIYTNTAQIQASQASDPDSTPNNSSMTEDDESIIVTNPRRPVLTISKKGPDKVRANEPIVYQLTITNSGEVAANNLIVTDTIPTEAVYVTGGNAVISNVLYWSSIPILKVGETAQVNFTVKATRDITNSQYGVQADGGVQATGLVSVMTHVFVGSQGVFVNSGQQLGKGNNQAASTADLDNDGDQDAFVAGTESNQVWLNDGTGKFTQTQQTLGNGQSQAVGLADIDHDGDTDAVVGNQGNDEVWLNDGTGHFTNTGQTLNSGNTQAIGLGDIDHDGDIDAVVGNDNNNQVWLNDGTGIFTNSGQVLNSDTTQAISLGDIDQDGDTDAVMGNVGNDQVWLNDGTGIFTNSGQVLNSGNTQAISLGDIDQDGDTDAVLGNTGNDQVWLNDGTGKFSDSGQVLNSGNSQAIALGDLDEDGDTDAVLGNDESHVVMLNDGTGKFSDSGQVLNSGNTQAIALGDLDGDTDLDTFISVDNNGGSQVWFNQNEQIATFDKLGGQFDLSQGLTFTLDIPANALDQSTVLTYTPKATVGWPLSTSLRLLGQSFTIVAEQGGIEGEPTLAKPLVATMYYQAAGIESAKVRLYYYNTVTKQWRDVATTCTPASTYTHGTNFIQVGICHLTEFALVQEISRKRLYLPLVRK